MRSRVHRFPLILDLTVSRPLAKALPRAAERNPDTNYTSSHCIASITTRVTESVSCDNRIAVHFGCDQSAMPNGHQCQQSALRATRRRDIAWSRSQDSSRLPGRDLHSHHLCYFNPLRREKPTIGSKFNKNFVVQRYSNATRWRSR